MCFAVGDKPERSLTYQGLHEKAIRLAHMLRFQLQVQLNEPVCIVSPNVLEYIEFYFGNAYNGSCTANIAFLLAGPEMIKVINNTGSSVVFVAPTSVDLVNKIKKDLKHVKKYIYFSPHIDDEEPMG